MSARPIYVVSSYYITLPLTDIVIGCSAKKIGASVLTLDRHFCDIPGIRVLRNLES